MQAQEWAFESSMASCESKVKFTLTTMYAVAEDSHIKLLLLSTMNLIVPVPGMECKVTRQLLENYFVSMYFPLLITMEGKGMRE